MFTCLVQRYLPDSELGQSFFPPATSFNPDTDIPELSGKIYLVTGGSSGIGKETCKQLLAHGGKVYLAARSEEKARAAIDEILGDVGREAGERLLFHQLDLSELAAVKVSAEEFFQREGRIDVLFNNAGVMMCPVEDLTKDGYDMQFGTNVLGHYLFTKLLMPALLASHEASGVPARVVNLSSSGHKYTAPGSGFDEATLVGGPQRDERLASWGFPVKQYLYGQSKLGNLFLSSLLAAAYPTSQLVAVSVHPGAINTDLARHLVAPRLKAILQRVQGWMVFPVRMGAYNSLWAGVVAAPEEVHGQYVIPWARIGKASEKAEDEATREQVNRWLDKQLLEHGL